MNKHGQLWVLALTCNILLVLHSFACISPPQPTLDAGPPEIRSKQEVPVSPEPTPDDAKPRKPCDIPPDCVKASCAGKSCGDGCMCRKTQAIETSCTDGIDNDGDGSTDCEDPDCQGESCGQAGCICDRGKIAENICNDGVDNDGDGYTDCSDPDCDGKSCGKGCVCANHVKSEGSCNDGVDGDGDGKIDCVDPDCKGDPTCKEDCTDGKDNNRDGLVDCEDPFCNEKACGKTCLCKNATWNSCDPAKLTALFKTRIEPLVRKGAPSSCNQCHLSGVDLSLFVKSTPCSSMACMHAQGLVDFGSPENSKILKSILQGKPKSNLITKSIQQKEYQGFLEWIQFSATCQTFVCGDIPNACGTGGTNPAPAKTLPMLGGCDEKSLVTRFQVFIGPWRGRCKHCHGADIKHPQAPGYFDTKETYEGDRRTMYNIIGMGALDLKNPEQSRLLLKPLAVSEGGIAHGGGGKIASKSEQTYIDFLAWIKSYAACATKTP